jgi:ligand-binding sensor domain-containing protein
MKNRKLDFTKYFFALLFTFLISQTCIADELFTIKGGLPSQTAKKINVSSNKVLFSGGVNGILIYDKETSNFTAYTKKDNKYLAKTYDVVEAFEKIWVATDSALLSIDEDGSISEILKIETASITRPGDVNQPRMSKVRKLFYEGGYLWVSCFGVHGGLFRYDGSGWEEVRFGLSPFNYCTDVKVVGDNIWYGTISLGVYVYNVPTREWRTLNSASKDTVKLPNNTIASLTYANGNLWVGSRDGVFEIKKDEKEFKFDVVVHDSKSSNGQLESTGTTKITSSEEGDIFVSAPKGISKYSEGKWERLAFTDGENNPIDVKRYYTVQADGDSVWIGCDKGIIKTD